MTKNWLDEMLLAYSDALINGTERDVLDKRRDLHNAVWEHVERAATTVVDACGPLMQLVLMDGEKYNEWSVHNVVTRLMAEEK